MGVVDKDNSGDVDYEEFQSWCMGDYKQRLAELAGTGMQPAAGIGTMTEHEAITAVVMGLEEAGAELERLQAEAADGRDACKAVVLATLTELELVIDVEPPASERLVVPLPGWVDDKCLTGEILDFFAAHLPAVPRRAMDPEFPADRAAAERAQADEDAAAFEADMVPAAGSDLGGWLPLTGLVAGWSPLTIEVRPSWPTAGVARLPLAPR